MLRRCSWGGAAALALLFAATPVQAQALIVNGEEIADAKLMGAAKAEGRVNLYGTYPSETIGPVLDAFKKDTKLDLDYVRLPGFQMFERLSREFEADKMDADYADLTDLSLAKIWKERGIFVQHRVPSFAKLPEELRDPDGYWYYLVRPTYVLGVNTVEVAEKDYPKSWRDTFDPKWKGKIGTVSIDAGGSALTLYSFLRLKIGEDAWTKVAANEPRLYASAAPIANDLVRGRVSICYCGASAITGQIENGAPLKIIFPTEGLASFGSIGNVTSKAKHPNAAKVWMNYVTSKHGSQLVAATGSYGTHSEAAPPSFRGQSYPPPSQVWTIKPDEWEKYHESWPTEWKQVFQQK